MAGSHLLVYLWPVLAHAFAARDHERVVQELGSASQDGEIYLAFPLACGSVPSP
jgi:hypothetical protein